SERTSKTHFPWSGIQAAELEPVPQVSGGWHRPPPDPFGAGPGSTLLSVRRASSPRLLIGYAHWLGELLLPPRCALRSSIAWLFAGFRSGGLNRGSWPRKSGSSGPLKPSR